MSIAAITYHHVEVQGLRLFYRAAGAPDRPLLLLLHGFPSSSQQYRRLMETLGTRYRLIAPDYPGFGHSDAPLPSSQGGDFRYSFDRLAELTEAFCEALGLSRFVLYAFDYGGPIGLRLAQRHPEWIAGLVLQNANSYWEGLSAVARDFVALNPTTPDSAARLRPLLSLESTRAQYEGGTARPERIAPEGWLLDQHFLDLPGRAEIQIELALDYHSNVALYPQWQAWLREHRPPALVVWGRNDPFFIEAGAHAYLRDLPEARLRVYDTGHFALEECGVEIAAEIVDWMEGQVLPASSASIVSCTASASA